MSFRLKQLQLNLYRGVLESSSLRLQTVVCHALHVAVHTEPHVTPAAYPLAVQFNQADDMHHDIPLKSALLGQGGMCELQDSSLTSGAQIKLICDSGEMHSL